MPNLTFAVAVKSKAGVRLISAGQNNNLAIKNKSTFAWGSNTSGALGDNSTIDTGSPESICGTNKTFCVIAVGNVATNHASAIDRYGRVWTWGSGTSGGLGNNQTGPRSTPVSICGAVKTFCKIYTGQNRVTAIDQFGRAWSWGSGAFGALGINLAANRSTPVSVCGAVKTFCEIALGNAHAVILQNNGRLWSWGPNTQGQLGINTAVGSALTPVSVCGAVKTFCKVDASTNTSQAIDKYGMIWSWGLGTSGILGNNQTGNRSTPVSVCGAVKTFCKISTGGTFAVAIDKYGKVWTWGSNTGSQLGDGTTTDRSTPIAVGGATKTFCEISTGNAHTVAVDKNGKFWVWGNTANTSGELGLGFRAVTPSKIVSNNRSFCNVKGSGTGETGFFLDNLGTVWGWGLNTLGKLGNNSTSIVCSPVSLAGATKTFCEISAGSAATSAIDKNGKAWSWGDGTNYRLGTGDNLNYSTPKSIAGANKTFCKITANTNFTGYGIDKNGRIWSWGTNGSGALGINTTATCLASTPHSICGAVKTFCHIDSGTGCALAIDKNGLIWGWGLNTSGNLGDNTVVSKITPVSIVGATKTFCKITLRTTTALAIDKNGRVWGWGSNTNGGLGTNSTTNSSTPRAICGALKTFCEIVTGSNYTIAIDNRGLIWSWGTNTVGQLGDGTLTSRLTPVSIAGQRKTFCKVAILGTATVAMDNYNKAWTWGSNLSGQAAKGYIPWTPVRISII